MGAAVEIREFALAHLKKRILLFGKLPTEVRDVSRLNRIVRKILVNTDVLRKRELLRQEEEHKLA